jgi:glycosyltransferase involved in cell wall biosynthesis
MPPDPGADADRRRPAISVVIPVYGAAEAMRSQLGALAVQDVTQPWELVVADNGANDRLPALLADVPGLPAPVVVDATFRRGPSFARNVGARAAHGDLIVFVDADDEVAPSYLRAMAEGLTRHRFVGARVDHERLNTWGGPVHVEWQLEGPNRFGDHPLVAAGTMGIQRSFFDELGGFDEELLGAEDDDLCVRASLAGSPVVFLPDALVHYRARTTLRGHFRQQRQWGRNDILFFARNDAVRWSIPGRAPVEALPEIAPAPEGASPGRRSGPPGPVRVLRRLGRLRTRADIAFLVGQLGWHLGHAEGRRLARRAGQDVRSFHW